MCVYIGDCTYGVRIFLLNKNDSLPIYTQQKKQKKQHKQQQQKQQQAKPPKHIEVITLSDDEEGCPTGSGSQGVLVYGAAVVDGIGGDGDGRQFKEEEEEVDVLVEYDFTVNKEEEQWV